MIIIPLLLQLQGLDAQSAAPVLLERGLCLKVASVNWPETYPACPETYVHIATSADKLYIRYDVRGEQLRAVAAHDQEEVWCDSCVEFFCQLPSSNGYMNFETNCIGTMVASRREGRDKNVRPLSSEQMALIDRYSSVGTEPFEEKDGEFAWTIVIAIPWNLITEDGTKPTALRANFYKCADKTKQVHFVSWNPIDLPQPNFHCPEFFAELKVGEEK